MERVKQSDILDGMVVELKEVTSTMRTLVNLMVDNNDGINNIDALDVLRIFQMLSRKLNDVTDTIDDVSYEIGRGGL